MRALASTITSPFFLPNWHHGCRQTVPLRMPWRRVWHGGQWKVIRKMEDCCKICRRTPLYPAEPRSSRSTAFPTWLGDLLPPGRKPPPPGFKRRNVCSIKPFRLSLLLQIPHLGCPAVYALLHKVSGYPYARWKAPQPCGWFWTASHRHTCLGCQQT
jgi:hypothetical protein